MGTQKLLLNIKTCRALSTNKYIVVVVVVVVVVSLL